ncbi:MAG TPA: hypothetical protein PK846_19385 [Spirochaetota bacterium]|nr:hypothetical protein [Spirochaetota bacterium]
MGLIKWLLSPPRETYNPTRSYSLHITNTRKCLSIECGIHPCDIESVLENISAEFNEHIYGVPDRKSHVRISARNAIDYADKGLPAYIMINNTCIVMLIERLNNIKTLVALKIIKEVLKD